MALLSISRSSDVINDISSLLYSRTRIVSCIDIYICYRRCDSGVFGHRTQRSSIYLAAVSPSPGIRRIFNISSPKTNKKDRHTGYCSAQHGISVLYNSNTSIGCNQCHAPSPERDPKEWVSGVFDAMLLHALANISSTSRRRCVETILRSTVNVPSS